MPLGVTCLGQSGLRVDAGGTVLYVDPYLSDSVFEAEGEQGRRMRPAPMAPAEVTDADWVLVTHEHLDHCDPNTLVPLAQASPRARFVVPVHLRDRLAAWGLPAAAVQGARPGWSTLAGGVRLATFRTSHPEPRDVDGHPWSVGYVIEWEGRRIAATGDTSLTEDLVQQMQPYAPFDAAFLPVNERNFLKEARGIVGNMSVREAFGLASMMGAKRLVPQHWDMFAANCVFPEEIEALRRRLRPPFELELPTEEVFI